MTSPPRTPEEGAGRFEERRAASVNLVQAAYRLARACQLYNDANQTVQQMLGPAVEAVSTYCMLLDVEAARIVFSRDMVLVNRRMLRASREVFSLALHLGNMLASFDLNELVLDRAVTREALLRFFRTLIDAQRSAPLADALREESSRLVFARKSSRSESELDFDPNESPISRVVKNYAASILILQAFYAQHAAGDLRASRDVKRVAQKLVVMSDVQPELLMACALGAFPDADVARRAVSTAVISLAMARVVTREAAVLSTIALAALLADVGAPPSGAGGRPEHPAASTLFELSAMGQYYPASIRRNVIVFEALSLQSPTGALDDGSEPASLSSMLFVARAFNELRTPRPGQRTMSVDEAMRKLEAWCSSQADFIHLRLLTVALGFYPLDSIVALNTGELARVIGVPRVALDFARPRVQILTDPSQIHLAEPFEIDLARQPPGGMTRSIQGLGGSG